jgi:aminodeoxyfutalosine synthase
MTDRFADLAARVSAGEPLSAGDVTALAQTTDILTLGMLADEARRRKHGADTTFVRVAVVTVSAAGGTVVIPVAAGEVRIDGLAGPIEALLPRVRAIAAAAGAVPVSACSLSDLQAHADSSGVPIADLLRAVRHAGVTLIADAPLDRLRDPEAALDAVRSAGLGLARLTIQHHAAGAHRVNQILRAAELQHALGWIQSFAPLARTWDAASVSTGYEDVRQIALARLLADNIPSIQVDWSLYGPKLAQVALTVGADDVDGVSATDDESEGRRRAPLEEIRRNIQAAALVAVERDGAYRRIPG